MHYHDPRLERAHVAIFYRSALVRVKDGSHVGLGVNGLHTVQVLRHHRIRATLHGVWEPTDIASVLAETPSVTHALVEALWVDTPALASLLAEFPSVHFIVRSHSEVAFLQVEPGAISLLRDQIPFAEQSLNLTIAANSRRLAEFLRKAYDGRVLYLPNLYELDRATRRPTEGHHHRLLRVGCFGALRWLKNHSTAAAAALTLARDRGCDLEFWMSVSREEHGWSVLQAVRNLFVGLPWASLREAPWQSWPEFRRLVRSMDLTIQVSHTETFCLVVADSVAEGVPSVVSHAIEWAPSDWKATPDDIHSIARIGSMLLSNPASADEGLSALNRHAEHAIDTWKRYLNDDPRCLHPLP